MAAGMRSALSVHVSALPKGRSANQGKGRRAKPSIKTRKSRRAAAAF